MGLALYILVASGAQQVWNSVSNAQRCTIDGKTISCSPESLIQKTLQAFKGGTVGRSSINHFGEPDSAARTQNACTFCDQGLPALSKQNSHQEASVDQIEGGFGKVERLGNI